MITVNLDVMNTHNYGEGEGDDDVEDNVDNIENHFTVLYN